MHAHIWHNGRITTVEDGRLNPASAGALYGWGVFTTLGIVGAIPRAFDLHWERLLAHAARASVPFDWPKGLIERGLFDLIDLGGIVDGRARITVLRASAGMWQAAATGVASDVLMFVAEPMARSRTPYAITVSPYRVMSTSPLAGVKTTSYLPQVLALEEARQRGFDEAVLLNERGEVVEATASNIFWVHHGELFTPSLGTGCLSGVTRRRVIEAAHRLKIPVNEGGHLLSMLHQADEVFLTNSGWGCMHVIQFDVHAYPAEPGPILVRILDALQTGL